jgi:UDP-glucuronate 4-epimerase
MRVLLSGSTGFVGGALKTHLMNRSWDVVCIENRQIPEDAFFDVIIHAGACPSAVECIAEPTKGLNNITFTFELLEFCRRNKIPKFVFMSTCEVYGRTMTQVDEDAPLESFNMYGASKVAGEHMCMAYSHSYGIQTIILRIMNVWGPGCHPDRFPSVIERAFKEREVPHFKLQTRVKKRWIHVDDLIEKTRQIIEVQNLPLTETFNVTGPENLDLPNFISKFGKNFTFEYKEGTRGNGYQNDISADGSKLAHLLDDPFYVFGFEDDPATDNNVRT